MAGKTMQTIVLSALISLSVSNTWARAVVTSPGPSTESTTLKDLSDYEVSLVPPAAEPYVTHKGTVLIRKKETSEWGTICDNSWTLYNANVTCRMLGFPGAERRHTKSAFGTLWNYSYVLEDVYCVGHELSLSDCLDFKFGSHRCDKSLGKDSGVTCLLPAAAAADSTTKKSVSSTTSAQDKITYEVSLVPPAAEPNATHKGTVIIRKKGSAEWGTICDDAWTDNNAHVTCRMLGFSGAAQSHSQSEFGTVWNHSYVLKGIWCTGKELSLSDCLYFNFGQQNNCVKKNGEDAGVTCVLPTTTTTEGTTIKSRMSTTPTTATTADSTNRRSESSTVSAPGKEECPDKKVLPSSALTNTADLSFYVNGILHTVQLPVGKHAYKIGYPSKECLTTIQVLDSNIIRRVDIQAKYSVSCSVLASDTNKQMLRTILFYRYADVEAILAGNGGRPSDGNASMECIQDTLTVTWPTSLVYMADISTVPASVLNAINSRLTPQDNRFELVIFTITPPFLKPKQNGNGLIADVVMTTTCRNNKVYSEQEETCIDQV